MPLDRLQDALQLAVIQTHKHLGTFITELVLALLRATNSEDCKVGCSSFETSPTDCAADGSQSNAMCG